ncbi:MAG: diguanylate cyclase [Desulfatiglandaceae bacterium]|jgi:diguanylate cyclase (GGDEF)-like protein
MKEKILVIDDEPEIRELLSEILQGEGFEVFGAADGVEGLELFHDIKPDLVITDVKMPRKDGLAVLKEVKEAKSDIDVIILTGHSDEATAIECLQSGAYDYLLKPVEDIEVLLIAVNRAIHKRNLELKNKDLLRQLEEMAIRDPLTGLYNFRQLHVSLDQEMTRSQRYGHSFCVFIVDVDHFKAVNDNYGHLFGDHVLKKLGEIMQRALRNTDRLFRYGGEEFFVLMPETSQEEASTVADRIMDAIRTHTFICDEKGAKITVSIGGAGFPFQSIDNVELIKLADQALYKAKESGRDRIVFSEVSI